MATITITIPAATTSRVIDGFARRFNYSPILEDGSANPETKSQFAKRKLIEYIKQAVRRSRNTGRNQHRRDHSGPERGHGHTTQLA